ncbi:MAG TPA: cell envelope biogenesis protein TolA [Burkholderiales bacterium]|nr:cell envelope biogenesis protein TolA [Burkholderiales bacterium]
MHTPYELQDSGNHVWRDRLLTAGAAIVIGLALSNTAPAADQVSRETKREADAKYDQTVKQIKADYKAARARCNNLGGNDKDVCVKEAQANEQTAMADAKAMKKNTENNADARAEKRDAEFKVAKEKCDSMSGNAKDVCEKEAEAKYRQ